ncbi:MAG: threonylcarbamoyl-AMP synthase [Actinobacteria bacterium]|nr:threonylcarbamoyl-AMP synthase [Actinomycetota bacterium]
MSDTVDAAVAALRGGQLAVVPTDTVYGLAANPYLEAPVSRLYRAKGRGAQQPTALVASDLTMLFECVPELRGRAGTIASALLPGPYTLVLPNPARRYRWLTGSTPEAIGVRVPELTGPAWEILDRVGAFAATSANLHGEADPRSLDEVPAEIVATAAAVVDGGTLTGTPSTVLDFTGDEPRVLREGAAPSDEALRLVSSLV